jgi:Ca2+-binding RTX toxin-like protein
MPKPRRLRTTDTPDHAPIHGSDDPDILRGARDAPNEIWGHGGDDELYGGALADLLLGGADDDRLTGGAGDDDLYGEDGDDVLTGGGGDDRLYAGTGRDLLRGGAGLDTLFVESADVSAGDAWDGGDGHDRISFTITGDGRVLDLSRVRITGVEDFALSEDAAVSLAMTARQLAGFDLFWLLPAAAAEAAHQVTLTSGGTIDLTGPGSIILPVLRLADARTRLDLSGTSAVIGTIHGGTAADTLWLGTQRASVSAGDGDDVVRSGGGALYADGGAGSDRLIGSDAADVLQGGAGDDDLRGGGGNDYLTGYDLGSTRTPDDLDLLDGGAGDDQITTWGTAHIQGGDGNDRILVPAYAGTTIDGGAGDDTILVDTTGLTRSDLILTGGDGFDSAQLAGNGDLPFDYTGATLDVEMLRLDGALLTIAQIEALHGVDVQDLYVADGGTLDLRGWGITSPYTVLYLSDAPIELWLASEANAMTVSGGAGNAGSSPERPWCASMPAVARTCWSMPTASAGGRSAARR